MYMKEIWRFGKFILIGILSMAFVYGAVRIGSYFISGVHDGQVVDTARQAYYQDSTDTNQQNTKVEEAQTDTQEDAQMKAYLSLLEVNGDAVGWIRIPDTEVDYPVVQADDNEYYLQHNIKHESSARGCIFMDCRNFGDGSDNHILLYGHNMKDGSMMGGLSLYLDEDYYVSHTEIETNIVGTGVRWVIFSVYTTSDDVLDVHFSSLSEYAEYVHELKGRSLFDTGVDVTGEDRVLTMSTCIGSHRLLIHAKQMEQ